MDKSQGKAGSESYWGQTRNIGQHLISPPVQDTALGEREWDPFPVFYGRVINPAKTAFRDGNADTVLSVVTAVARVSIELALSSQEHLNKTRAKPRGNTQTVSEGTLLNRFSRLWIKFHSLQEKILKGERQTQQQEVTKTTIIVIIMMMILILY